MVEWRANAEKRQDEPGASYSAKETILKKIKRWACQTEESTQKGSQWPKLEQFVQNNNAKINNTAIWIRTQSTK